MHAGIRNRSYVCTYLQVRSLGLRRAKGPRGSGWCGNRGVLMQVLACWSWQGCCEAQADPCCLHLGSALKQVFIFEFDNAQCEYAHTSLSYTSLTSPLDRLEPNLVSCAVLRHGYM